MKHSTSGERADAAYNRYVANHVAQREKDALLQRLGRVTQDECTCGGNPYEDPLACPACKVYHRMMRLS